MRILFILALLLAVFLPAGALTPDEVVRHLYTSHRQLQSLEKTMAQNRTLFTLDFIKLYQAAVRKKPEEGDFLNYDFLINSQDSWNDFEVGATASSGKTATVPVKLWMGPAGSSDGKSGTVYQAKIYLVNEGHGYQINDIEHLSHDVLYGNDKVDHVRSHRVRQELRRIVNARPTP